MEWILNFLLVIQSRKQKRYTHRLLFVIGILFLTALACNIPGSGGTPPPAGSIGTIQKEFSDVLQNAVQVESINPLNQGDVLRMQNGGVGLLEFGEDLRLRLFNETMAGEIVATHMQSVPNSPLIVRLALFAGGFSGQLYKPGSKATFTTPGGAQIVVLGTDFFVVYDPDSKITTVGNFSGTMGVIAGGESVSLASGHFLEIPREGPPGEQQQLRFNFKEFEDRARSRKSPILALRDDSGTPVAQVSPTITSNAFETDTDQDGLVDGDESLPCPDPNDPDTDGDGFIDGKDLDPCDENNPSLTLTAEELTPVVTPVTPVPPTPQPPNDTPTPTPSPTPTSEPPNLDELLAEAIEKLKPGNMVFNPPETMTQAKVVRIKLRIAPEVYVEGITPGVPIPTDVVATLTSVAPTQTKAVETLTSELQGQGELVIEPIRIGSLMKADLKGDGFEITPLSEEEQIVTYDTFTEWAWDVKAIRSGELNLNLTVTVKVVVDGLGEKERDIPVKTYSVLVDVNPVYTIQTFVGDYWQWLVTVALIPLIGWGWSMYSKRRAEKKKKKENSHRYFE